MPCYFPLDAWRLPQCSPLSNSPITFQPRYHGTAEHLKLPCGQCIGCKLERSRQWAVRLVHEGQLHERSSFLTLTFKDKFYPKDGSVSVRTMQLFMKRLRKRLGYTKLRFFLCGEYGEKTGRAHYHVILFGEDFIRIRKNLRKPCEPSQSGLPQWTSPILDQVWSCPDTGESYGRATIGDVTFESAAYVARYCLKKITGEKAASHYDGRKPEFVTMSRRPGIGAGWLDKFGLANTYNHDTVVMRGQEMLPPKFYDKLLEKADPQLYEKIKRERRPVVPFDENPENTPRRRRVRATVKRRTIKSTLKRSIE